MVFNSLIKICLILIMLAMYINAYNISYNPKKSKTYRTRFMYPSETLKYGTGSTKLIGYEITDVVDIEDTFADMDFFCITNFVGSWEGRDGILGMSLGSDSYYEFLSTFNLPKFFSMYLSNIYGSFITPSVLQLGAYDTNAYIPPFSAFNVIPESDGSFYFWQLKLTSIYYGSYELTNNTESLALVDTGTSDLIFPIKVFQYFYYTMQIQQNLSLPFIFTLNGNNVTLPASAFVNLLNNKYYLDIGGWTDKKHILGVPFLRYFYTIYDYTDSKVPKIQIAKANPKYQGPTKAQRNSKIYNLHHHRVEKKQMHRYENTIQMTSSNISLTNVYNNYYLVNISVGTPKQGPFNLIVDTGSSMLTVRSTGSPFPWVIIIVVFVFVALLILIALLSYKLAYYRKKIKYLQTIEDHSLNTD
eukprot:TRINITY_DN3103_c0_g1_i2.p1 TRINITY_DN3103_c0_g1~~TRINITY_DN3103_c0_g1_i2.p1  ORF type:complete len:415 (-),score=47.20 TRINITY_DN3103_c0_g1_i2:33-1277(-)